jgi:hypothetical protein
VNGGFLDYLHGCKVVATCAPNHPDFVTALEERYADFLRNEKGLAELSLKVYLPVATDLLHHLEEDCRITAVAIWMLIVQLGAGGHWRSQPGNLHETLRAGPSGIPRSWPGRARAALLELGVVQAQMLGPPTDPVGTSQVGGRLPDLLGEPAA